MSGGTYKPRADSVAAQLIAHLKRAPAGTSLNVEAIAVLCKTKMESVYTVLRPAVDAGLLQFFTPDDSSVRHYRLPLEMTEDERQGADLNITSDSTGDLWFTGATVGAGGEVLLTGKQLRQLVCYATTAPAARIPEAAKP